MTDDVADLSKDDFTYFVRKFERLLPTTPIEADVPGCRDDEVVAAAGREVPTIVSRFWVNMTIDDLAQYVDPRWWPTVGVPFWQEMSLVDNYQPTANGYSGRFKEVVRLPTGLVTAYLDVVVAREGDTVWMTYQEAPDVDDDVDVDRGCVMATTATFDPAATGVPAKGDHSLVYATKSIIFTDPALNGYADLACDNGWVALMIGMAERALGTATQTLPPVAPPASQTSPPDLVTQWVQMATKLVSDTADFGRSAVDAAGDGSTGWGLLKSYLSLWDEAATTTSIGLQAIRAGLHGFADRVGGGSR